MQEDTYCIDASSLIDLKDLYPSKVFSTLWGNLEELIRNGRLISTREVLRELEQGHDELTAWARERRETFLTPTKEEVEVVKKILHSFPQLIDPSKQGRDADPFIIALAIVRGSQGLPGIFVSKHIIVTQESKGNPNKIPRVSSAHNIQCINLLELFEKEGWKF